jgi:raffinose/stachyose/melibiose transport system permease protein
MREKFRLRETLYWALMAVYLVVIFYPVYLMVVTSLKPNAEVFTNPFGPPRGLYLDNYVNMVSRSNYGTYFVNSIVVVVSSIAAIVVLSSLAAYILAKYRFRGSAALYAFFVAGLIIPIKLGTISILKLMIGWGLNDSLGSVILVSVATGIPFGVFILTDFIRMIPEELSAAARIDGCGEASIFGRIIAPLLLPAIAAVAVVNFIPVWNEFWFPLVLLKSDAVKTVPLATALLFGQYQTNYGYVFAVLTMASVPVVLMYLIFSKWFIKGMTEGSVKG